jgi:hypothetical protein
MATEARARERAELENGELLNVTKAAGFGVLVTTDKISATSKTIGMQDSDCRLETRTWSLLKRHVAELVATVNAATPGGFAEVKIPFE